MAGTLELSSTVTRMVDCDVAYIGICFFDEGENGGEVSENVMKECERFLACIGKLGFTPGDFRLEKDVVREPSYREEKNLKGERELLIRMPYNMGLINSIREILVEGKFKHRISVDGEISDPAQVRKMLMQEALRNSRMEAETLANEMGAKIKALVSIKDNGYPDDSVFDEKCEKELCRSKSCESRYEQSDDLSAMQVEKSLTMYFKWEME